MAATIYCIVAIVPTSVLRTLYGFSLLSLSTTVVGAIIPPILPMALRLKES